MYWAGVSLAGKPDFGLPCVEHSHFGLAVALAVALAITSGNIALGQKKNGVFFLEIFVVLSVQQRQHSSSIGIFSFFSYFRMHGDITQHWVP